MNKRKFLGILRDERINSNLIDVANKEVLLNKEIVLKNPKNDADERVSWLLSFDDYECNSENNVYTFNIDFLNEIYNAISDYSERDYYVSYNLNDVEVDWVDVQQKIDLTIEEGKKIEIALEVYKLLNEVSLEKKIESLKLKDDVSENNFIVKWSEIISLFHKPEFDVGYYSLYSKKPLRRLYVDFLNREVDNNWKEWVFWGILNKNILEGYLLYDLEKFKDDVFSDDYWISFITSLKFEKYNVVDIWSNFYSLSIINDRLSKIINQDDNKRPKEEEHFTEHPMSALEIAYYAYYMSEAKEKFTVNPFPSDKAYKELEEEFGKNWANIKNSYNEIFKDEDIRLKASRRSKITAVLNHLSPDAKILANKELQRI